MEQCYIKLNERKDKLQKMLAIQSSLQRRKLELAEQRGKLKPNVSLSQDTALEEESQKIYNQIYPILRDIHREEVRVLELKEQVERSAINKEIASVRDGIKKVCDQCVKAEAVSSYGQLYVWAKELKQEVKTDEPSNVQVTDVYYSANPPKAVNRNTELLTFFAGHQDFFVKITVEIHNIYFPAGSAPEVRITSDPHIPGLDTVGKDSFIQHASIKPLLHHLTETISAEILPYL